MIKHIQLIPLCIGILIGIIAIIFVKPEKNVIYKYPNPESSQTITYKDKNGVCYVYIPKKVNCDKNEDRMKNFPLSM